MGNTYDSTTILADPSSTVAARNVDRLTPQRIANGINYCIGAGGCHNVLSQSYQDKVFIQDSGFFTEMSQWRIPLISDDHNTLEVVIHYDIQGTSSTCKAKFTLQVGAVSANLEIDLPSTAEIADGSFSIAIPSSDEYYATLTMLTRADTTTPAEPIIKSVMARWTRISSPIPAGTIKQYEASDSLTPMGTSRTNINEAFTSRFAHNVIDNVTLLRKRLQSYLTWSNVYSASSSLFPLASDAGAPELYLSVGHARIMGGYPLAPTGYDKLTHRRLELHVRSIGKSSGIEFDFFGNRISISTSAGSVEWTIHTIELDYGRLSTRGDITLPYYDASLDNTQQNQSTLPNYGFIPTTRYPTVDSNNHGTILSLTLMGI